MKINKIDLNNEKEIIKIIGSAFAVEPWCDRWQEVDESVFHAYLKDLIGNPNSLALGLFDGHKLIGAALGRLKHWYNGIEYCIDDFCIIPSGQGQGAGTIFLRLIQEYAKQNHFNKITLWTNRKAPAYRFYQKNGLEELTDRVCFEKKIQ